jgi:tRNA threonylcarbamoyladenosine biosynthesis protein TsaE
VPVVDVPLDGDLAPVAALVCEGLAPGDVVTLSGPIGAGKTALVRACAAWLEVAEPVTSPTFALAHRYGGRVPVAHLDLYRLAGEPLRDAGDLLAELREDCVSFVEWPEAGAPWLPRAAVRVVISVADDGGRRFDVAPAA